MKFCILVILGLLFAACKSEPAAGPKTELSQIISEEYIEKTPTKNAYFGDLHVHTSWSFDAFIYNTRTTPDDAYRFAKGEAIDHYMGEKIQTKRPLDFMAVTDHSEYMGVMMQMNDADHSFYKLPIAEQVRSKDRATSLETFTYIGTSIARNAPFGELMDYDIRKSTWNRIVEAANEHYEPGKFTTFPGYEFTSTPSDSIKQGDIVTTFARNLHRNVIYKGDKVSEIPYSSFDSQNPEDLWDWMDNERKRGIELIAIPHNGNMSDGLMYSSFQFNGSPMTLAYINQRMRNEPINEVVQIKGQSMSHPILNSNDEFADFELSQFTFSTTLPPPSRPNGSYVREAYQNGLKFGKDLGANPFKFGLIGSSDGHNSAGATDEDNYFGKFVSRDGTAERRLNTEDRFLSNRFMSAAGLAGVWAESNTREAIYSALERKETFATSGPRILARLFAGENINVDFDDENWLKSAYAQGVPMGGDLEKPETPPDFVIWAIKDANGANLDRVQMIKTWIDDEGNPREKIFNVAWSDSREPYGDGSLPAVGNTVDVSAATYENSVGAVELKTIWKDPEFNEKQIAMYYLRILEIPTPRWSTYDARDLGIDIPNDLSATIQERAWTSPIWYTP